MRIEKIELIEKLLEDAGFYVKHNPVNQLKGWIEIRCPYCGDSKKNPYKTHANIDVNKRLFHCFRCEASGLDNLLKDFNLDEIKRLIYEDNYVSNIFAFVSLFEQINFKNLQLENVNNFKFKLINFAKMKDLMEDKQSELYKIAREYLENREFDYDYLENEHDVFVVTNSNIPLFEEFQSRIVFPSINRISFNSRGFFKHKKPKYRKPTGRPDDLIGIIRNEKEIFLTEGPLDALKLNQFGYDAVSLNGKGTAALEISMYNLLLRKRILSKEKIIYFQDREVVDKELFRIIKKIHKYLNYKDIYFVNMEILPKEYKDAGDINDKKIIKTILKDGLIKYAPELAYSIAQTQKIIKNLNEKENLND